MWLLVGLGNPGAAYEGHRHNVGFMVLDALAGPGAAYRNKFQGQFAELRIGADKIALLKPMTYMNVSGQSVRQAADFYKITPERIVVFHDELDLPPGALRVKKGGGNAGHNGLKSIQVHLGTPEFWRVRIGIGHPGDKNRVSDYVLSDFSREDMAWVGRMKDDLARILVDLPAKGPEIFSGAGGSAAK